MKTICLILLLGSSLSCYGDDKELEKENSQKIEDSKCVDPAKCVNATKSDSKGYDTLKNERYSDQNDQYNDEKNEYDEYDDKYEYVGNPDFDAEIERPCRVFDLNCIRKYFAEHSNCKIRRGPLPESFLRYQESIYFSNVNLTITLLNVRVGGLRNTRIEEFYINKKTNKMVFSLQMRDLSSIIPTVYFQFYRKGREPIVTVTDSANIYFTISFTAVIPMDDGIQLDKAEITAFVDALPAFYIGTDVASVPDPAVVEALARFYSDLPTAAQEMFLTESQLYPPLYIQFNICDFELDLNL